MAFYRKIEDRLYANYMNKDEKVLIINGARQIGKSFIIRQTASKYFKNYIEINLRDDFDNNKLFDNVHSANDFYLQVSALYGNNLGNIDDTIIFLDEIQVYPHLLTLLKSLKQDNRYRYIASGSLLGITLRHAFIPMGSIEEINMYPMDFEEFLIANGIGKDAFNYLKDCFINHQSINEGIHKTMLQKFKEYLISGGLPDAVKAFVLEKNIMNVRKVQTEINNYYKDDASKYDIDHSLKIRRIYDYLPSYMENKVKRIIFNRIENQKDANYEKYEDEFDYLINSGCTLDNKAIFDPKYPLDVSKSKNLIKLYYNDVGILSNILFSNNINAILNNDPAVNIGSLYETVAAMELIANGHDLYYFDSKKVGEVDFLINDYNELDVLPIEIKSGKNFNNFRAIPKLVDKEGKYKLNKGYIFSNANTIKEENDLLYYPIYLIMFV